MSEHPFIPVREFANLCKQAEKAVKTIDTYRSTALIRSWGGSDTASCCARAGRGYSR